VERVEHLAQKLFGRGVRQDPVRSRPQEAFERRAVRRVLEDALEPWVVVEQLGRWLLGRDPQAASRDPEQNVLLPAPVPIYVTYLTAHVEGGQLSLVDDIYRRDGEVASLR